MKKLTCLLAIFLLFLFVGNAWAPPPQPRMPYRDSNCNQAKYFGIGTLCADTDDGKLYKGTGVAVVELAAGASGDMTKVVYDAADNGAVDAAAGGTNIDSSGSTGTAYVTAGTWSIKSAADEKTALGLVIGTNVQAWDADLDYLATFTPTANVKSILNAADYAAVKGLLSIDDLVTLSGVADGEPDLGTFTGTTIPSDQTIKQALQALETALELKAPTTAPTFVTSVGLPATLTSAAAVTWTLKDNDASALSFGATGAADILKIGTLDLGPVVTVGGTLALGANNLTMTGSLAATGSRVLKGWFTDIESTNYPTVNGVAVFDQNVSTTGNPAFPTLNLVGANALSLGTSRTNDGKVTFKSGTALNDFVFEITGGNFAADLGWLLPIAAPGGNYLVGITAATKQIGYVNPSSIGALASDCSVGPCLDGSSDGGTYVAMYDGNSHYTKLVAGDSIANLTFTLPTAVAGGNNYLLNVDADGTMGYTSPVVTNFSGGNWKVLYSNGTGVLTEVALDVAGTVLTSNGVAAAPTMQAPAGAGDVTSVGDCTSGACNDETSDGGTYIGLYSASGAVRLRNNTGTMEARTAADAGYAPFKAASFDSDPGAGEVGHIRIKEEGGVNYRGLSVVSVLAEDLTFTYPTGTPTANDFFILSAPVAGVSAQTYSSLSGLMDTVLGSTRGSILYRGAAGWTILIPGDAGKVLTSAGAGADPTYNVVTATAAGETGYVQYNTADALDGEAAFSYNAGTDTLTVANITGTASGNIAKASLVAKGDLVTASAAATPAVITDVAAGQPLLSGGIAELPGYAGYTFTGTAAQTYTFPTTTATLARTDAGQTFTGVNAFTAPTITTSIAPAVAGASTLGTSAVEWGNVYLTDSAVIYGQINGSATFTSSASTWTASNFVSSGTTKTTGVLSPAAAGGTTVGSNALPYSSVYIGAAATNNIQLTGTAASAKVITLPGQTGNVTVSPTVATAGHAYLSSATEGIASWSTPTYPSASGTARTILVSDGTNNIYSTEVWPVPGAAGNLMQSDGTNWVASLNLATTGQVSGRVPVVSDGDGKTLSGTDLYGSMQLSTGAGTWTIPDVDSAAGTGQSFCVYATAAHEIVIAGDAEDKIRLHGVLGAAGGDITNNTAEAAGDFICLMLTDFAGEVAHWTTFGYKGTWTVVP